MKAGLCLILHTVAVKSPRFRPLTSQSLTNSSTSYRSMYWRSLSPALDPQWNEVLIVRTADIGWPAYSGSDLSVDVSANGVDKIRIRAAATIYGPIRWYHKSVCKAMRTLM
jgi:hypothetical protein